MIIVLYTDYWKQITDLNCLSVYNVIFKSYFLIEVIEIYIGKDYITCIYNFNKGEKQLK